MAGGLSRSNQVLHAGDGHISIWDHVLLLFAQGPVQEQADTGSGGTLGARCQGLHPLPVMFHCVLELEPGVRLVRIYFIIKMIDGTVLKIHIKYVSNLLTRLTMNKKEENKAYFCIGLKRFS